jgi:hypothetical protein
VIIEMWFSDIVNKSYVLSQVSHAASNAVQAVHARDWNSMYGGCDSSKKGSRCVSRWVMIDRSMSQM